jgi:polar amino acid transport system substrate-binding protein
METNSMTHPARIRAAHRRLLSGIVALAAAFPLLVHADVLDNIQQAKKIRVSIDPSAPPYSSKDDKLEYVGSEVDVARQLAKDWGVALEIVPTNPASRIPYVLTDKTDVVISTLSITPERTKVIDFSIPYSGIQVVVGAPRAKALHSLSDLASVKVATVRGSTNDIELTKAAPPGTQIIRFDDDATAITAILSGQADAYCTAPALLAPVNQRKPELAMEPKVVVKTNLTGIGLRKGETRLEEKLDAWIRENLRNGKLNAIYRKHHGADLSPEVTRAAGV